MTVIMDTLGSPAFKRATIVASGTYTEVWTLASTGSRLAISGWSISTDAPMMLGVVGSNLTSGTSVPTLLTRYRLPGSGTVERTFIHPITPFDAGIHIGIATGAAGSVDVTIYGKLVG